MAKSSINNINSFHTLEWDNFREQVSSVKILDDILTICKNLNDDNIKLLNIILSTNEGKEKHINKIDELYKKKELIIMNKKFEIKKNKEINIDVYYNNMTNLDNIINLSISEFKDFIEKGNTLEQNDVSLSIISKEIENCEKIINDLNNKIIELASEKDDKWKKWSYLYEIYRNMIGNTENKIDNTLLTDIVEPEKEKKIIKKKDKKNILDTIEEQFVLETVNNKVDIDNEKITEPPVSEKKIKKVSKKKDIINETINETVSETVNETVNETVDKEQDVSIKKTTKKKVLNNKDDGIKSEITNNELTNKKDKKKNSLIIF
jgi:hypothetical protein